MQKIKFLKTLDHLVTNECIAIYGSGDTGVKLKSMIEKNRKDISISFFIDSNDDGKIEKIPIYRLKNIHDYIKDINQIIIASIFWHDIERQLLIEGINCKYLIISNYILYQMSDIRNINNFYFSKEEFLKGKQNKLEQTKKLFKKERDIKLFSCLIDFRIKKIANKYNTWFLDNVSKRNNMYFDYLKKDFIQTIFEGGVYDGSDTYQFVQKFHNKKCIIGFEPDYNFFCKSPFYKLLQKDNIKIYPYQLSDKTFKNKENNNNNENPHFSKITGDDFVKNFHIEKVDYIKMDIEGDELKALKGFKKTIQSHRPQLAISIYHDKDHLYSIPLYLTSIVDNYSLYLNAYSDSFIDSVLYAIPHELEG